MKPLTHEWVMKAEGDFAMVEREARARKSPNYDGLCFHAQQCVEKYLKARLCEAGIEFPKLTFSPPCSISLRQLSRCGRHFESISFFSPVLRSASVILASLLTGKPHWRRANAAGCSGAWPVKRWDWRFDFAAVNQDKSHSNTLGEFLFLCIILHSPPEMPLPGE